MGRTACLLAAVAGLAAVGFAAAGAHLVADPEAAKRVATGAHVALPHAAAVLAIGERHPGAALAMAAGALLFSFLLYGLGLGLPEGFTLAVPVGGTLMLAGWGLLIVGLLRPRRTPRIR